MAADSPLHTPGGQPDAPAGHAVAAAIADITERSSVLIREEIELAKAEVEEKVTVLAKGAGVGVAAGVFVAIGGLFFLHGLAWLFAELFFDAIYWGFFVVAGLLFVTAGVAGFLAKKWLGVGSPAPTMAIEEAGKIKEAFAATPEGKA